MPKKLKRIFTLPEVTDNEYKKAGVAIPHSMKEQNLIFNIKQTLVANELSFGQATRILDCVAISLNKLLSNESDCDPDPIPF